MVKRHEHSNYFDDSIKLIPEGIYSSCNSSRQFYFQAKIWFEPTAGMEEEHENKIATSIYPNPFADEVNIGFNKPFTGQMQAFDVLGRIIYTGTFKNTLHDKIPLANLQKGVYMLRFTDSTSGHITVKRISKN